MQTLKSLRFGLGSMFMLSAESYSNFKCKVIIVLICTLNKENNN